MKNAQNALRAAAFLLGLILLLTGITWVFLPKNNTKEAGFDDTPCYGFLAERTHSLDVVFLGNSVPLFSVAPAVIWKEQGIPCYVCAQTSTALVDADRFLQDFLKTQSPKVVMLETDAVFWESDASQWEKQQLAQRFPLLRFHENWKSVALSQLIRPIHYTNRVDSEGYRFTAETVPWTKGDYVDFSAAPKPAPALSPEILKHIRSLCDENGADSLHRPQSQVVHLRQKPDAHANGRRAGGSLYRPESEAAGAGPGLVPGYLRRRRPYELARCPEGQPLSGTVPGPERA